MAKKEVIVVKQKEGCFLQTLNIGCATMVIIAVVIVLIAIASLSIK